MIGVSIRLPTFYRKPKKKEENRGHKVRLMLQRTTFTDESTIGCLFIDGKFECYTIEDTCRHVKIKGKTAIWAGEYRVVLSRSNRFGDRYGWEKLPELLEVPEFTGIRIHPLNEPGQTEGCIGPGTTKGRNVVHRSQRAFDRLMPKITAMCNEGELWISIIGGNHYGEANHV